MWRLHIRHNVVSSLVTVCPSQSYVQGFLDLTSTKHVGVNVTCSRPQRTATRPGLEPVTPWSVVRDANQCASPPIECLLATEIPPFRGFFGLAYTLLLRKGFIEEITKVDERPYRSKMFLIRLKTDLYEGCYLSS